MLIGEGNENLMVKKTTIGLINKKATLHAQHAFFVHFFAVVLHDYNVKWKFQNIPSYTFYGGNVVHVLVFFVFCFFAFFFHCRSFSPWWPLAFLIFSSPLQNFRVVFPTKNVSFCFFFFFISRASSLSLFSPFSIAGLPPTFSFSLSFSFSIFQICVHDN